mgnify:FL=1
MIEYYKNLSLESLFYINEDGLVCQEEWKGIPNWEGFYQVSNLSRVKSFSRKVFGGKVFYFTKEKIMKQSLNDCGYLFLTLQLKGVIKKSKIHQLVAVTFLNHKPCGYKVVVDHKNNNPLDNRLNNLQLITQFENSRKDKNPKSGNNCIYFENGKYRVRFMYNGKSSNFGRFDFKKDAVEVFDKINKMAAKGIDISDHIKSRTHQVAKNITIHQGKYRVRINVNKKTLRFPPFDNLEDAKSFVVKYKLENKIK